MVADEIKFIDSSQLPSTWKTAPRGWGHPLHKLSQYIGQYPPSLAHFFIRQYSQPGQVIFDPFSGGGTTALESLLSDRKAFAIDAFNYAYTLSRAKARPMELNAFERYLKRKLKETEMQLGDLALLDDPNLKIFYSEKTLDEILRLRAVLKDDDSDEAVFLKGVVCGILHGPSNMFLSLSMKDTVSSTPGYVERYVKEHKLVKPERKIYDCAMNKARRCLIAGIPERKGRIFHGDARSVPMEDESVDFVLHNRPMLVFKNYFDKLTKCQRQPNRRVLCRRKFKRFYENAFARNAARHLFSAGGNISLNMSRSHPTNVRAATTAKTGARAGT